ncbi:ABC transporter ATP-binding protein [Candidatus Symbiobacter mobilis]|uniref:Branched-chain amino acid transporter ATP-binding protein n=1 Tax=Candidatus Symbiobacter mobilis CR TaxID=946483 RepID=U5N431_9BURK|nr:ABC transporter ATP-binding protein [Candidatus Symbiobacter mobilis]AGX86241.1 branched-chain amino acid transporter ATP-binding protein [Candidatus Symbiobacter mobilis CR]
MNCSAPPTAPEAVPAITPVLDAQGVCKHFGGLHALRGVDLRVLPGQVHGLIGPNGAGKTTFFNVLTGVDPPDAGAFRILGQPYHPTAAHAVARVGIARTFQNIRLFAEMTVLENVMVGCHAHTHCGAIAALLRTRAFQREEANIARSALAWLEYVGLAAQAHRMARTLSYGDQRRLEIARALATRPTLIALDEPAAGMNESEKRALRELIARIRQDGHSVLLIEHDIALVMGLCDAITVLDCGECIARGTPTDVRNDERVIAAFLGTAGQADCDSDTTAMEDA